MQANKIISLINNCKFKIWFTFIIFFSFEYNFVKSYMIFKLKCVSQFFKSKLYLTKNNAYYFKNINVRVLKPKIKTLHYLLIGFQLVESLDDFIHCFI